MGDLASHLTPREARALGAQLVRHVLQTHHRSARGSLTADPAGAHADSTVSELKLRAGLSEGVAEVETYPGDHLVCRAVRFLEGLTHHHRPTQEGLGALVHQRDIPLGPERHHSARRLLGDGLAAAGGPE